MTLVSFCCIFLYIITRCIAVISDEHVITGLKSYFEREQHLAAQQQESRIKEMEKAIQELRLTQNKPTELLQLRMEMKRIQTAMSNEIQELKNKLDEKTNEVNVLKEQVEKLEQKQMMKESEVVPEGNFEKGNGNTDAVFVKTETELNKLQAEIAEMQTHKVQRRQFNAQGGPAVAFFARLTSDSPQLSPNQDIIFNDVVLNVGRGYHNVHGAFIAPVPGIYVFTTSVLSHLSGQHAAHAKLVKNGTLLAILDASEPDGVAQAGQTVIVQLEKGDDVAVQNEDYTGIVYHGSYYCTFSGFLLYDLSDDSAIVGK